MIQRITTPAPSINIPGRWWTAWHSLWAGPLLGLARYVLVLIVLCAIGCIYLWQASHVSDLNKAAQRLRYESEQLEAENASLMAQLARWNAPAYIEQRAKELGLTTGQAPVLVKIAPEKVLPGSEHTSQKPTSNLVQRLAGILPGR